MPDLKPPSRLEEKLAWIEEPSGYVFDAQAHLREDAAPCQFRFDGSRLTCLHHTSSRLAQPFNGHLLVDHHNQDANIKWQNKLLRLATWGGLTSTPTTVLLHFISDPPVLPEKTPYLLLLAP